MEIKKSLSSTDFSMAFKVFNHIQDPCKLTYKKKTNTSAQVVCDFQIDGTLYRESRYVPLGKKSTSFDVSAYIRLTETDWVSRFALHGANSVADWNTKRVTQLNEYVNVSIATAEPPFVYLNGSSCRNEPMCATRMHIYNPNFPHIVEFMPTKVEDDEAELQITFNTDDPSLYTVQCESEDNFPICQLLLNTYTDDMNDEDAHELFVSFPHHLEPSNEPNNEYNTFAEFASDMDAIVETCTDVRSDLYLYDNRKKGVFLRFIDRFGFIQQILLNVSGRESAVSLGDDLKVYQGEEHDYTNNVCGGSGIRNNKVITEVIHCGLNAVRKELKGDLLDLLSSPVVYMYRGGFDTETNDDTQCEWEAVSVTSNGITTNERSKLMDFSCDVTITTNNAYAV